MERSRTRCMTWYHHAFLRVFLPGVPVTLHAHLHESACIMSLPARSRCYFDTVACCGHCHVEVPPREGLHSQRPRWAHRYPDPRIIVS